MLAVPQERAFLAWNTSKPAISLGRQERPKSTDPSVGTRQQCDHCILGIGSLWDARYWGGVSQNIPRYYLFRGGFCLSFRVEISTAFLCFKPKTKPPFPAHHPKALPASAKTKNTTPLKSINSRGSRRSESARGCISVTRTNAVCTTAFSRCSTTRSTNILPAIAPKSKCPVHVDGSVSIRDNGRGIPVDMHPKFKMPAVELVLTNLHAGGKFGQGAYKYSGGLHGVGAKCVNALSDWFKVEVSRDGEGLSHGLRAREDDREARRHRRAEEQENHRHADHVSCRTRRSSRSRPSSSLSVSRVACANWLF